MESVVDFFSDVVPQVIYYYLFSCVATRGKFNNVSARERSLFWYLSLFVMCKA